MNIESLIERLIEVARADVPPGHASAGFERRVMARIAALSAVDPWMVRTMFLWRAAVSCAAAVVVFGALVWTTQVAGFNSQPRGLELESTVYALVESVEIW